MEQRIKQGEQNGALDLIRTAAILLVVLNHAVKNVYSMYPDQINALSKLNRLFCFTSFTLGCLGVPLFLMLTGYLMLPRRYDETQIRRFYKHNFLRLLLVWELWILVYDLFLCWFQKTPFDVVEYLRRAFFLEQAGLVHAWYMPMIIGIYLVLPFAAIALQHMNGKVLAGILAAVYLFQMVVPSIGVFQSAGILSGEPLEGKLDLDFTGNYYGVYLILGYCCARWKERMNGFINKDYPGKNKSRHRQSGMFLVLLFFCVLLSGVWMQIRIYATGYMYSIWYNNFLLPVMGTCMFLEMEKIHLKSACSKIVRRLSTDAFGVFLLHEPVLMVMMRYAGGPSGRAEDVVLVEILVSAISFAAVELLSAIPFMKTAFLKR